MSELAFNPGVVGPTLPRRAVGRWRALVRTPQASIGLPLLGLLVALIVLGPVLAPHDPDAISPLPGAGSSASHLLGTDLLGRDVLSRVLSGGRTVLILPIATVSFALAVATAIGLACGYLGGVVDAIVTRLLDVALAIPGVLIVLAAISGFGRGDVVLVLAVALVEIPRFARVLRASTQAVAPRDFVLAARARGETVRWVALGEILPNILPTLLVEVALGLTGAVLAVASLSFLGLGLQPPTANWAVMVSENRALLFTHPFGAVLLPALLIALLAISINLVADALTTVFDDPGTGT